MQDFSLAISRGAIGTSLLLYAVNYRKENQIINGNNKEVDLSLNNGGTEDDEIVIIKENTYIRSA